MSGVPYMDSVGLGVLVAARVRAQKIDGSRPIGRFEYLEAPLAQHLHSRLSRIPFYDIVDSVTCYRHMASIEEDVLAWLAIGNKAADFVDC